MSPAVATAAWQERLLQIARRALDAAVEKRQASPVGGPLPDELRRPAGAFVTLHTRTDGELRGCIGFIEARRPLAETVAEAAVAAALHDPRFEPVAPAELPRLRVEISVLTEAQPIAPDAVVVGKHGLIVERGSRRGLLLPQVPIEQEWDVTTFLNQTCRKAGLPLDAWREKETRLSAFEAQVFGETET